MHPNRQLLSFTRGRILPFLVIFVSFFLMAADTGFRPDLDLSIRSWIESQVSQNRFLRSFHPNEEFVVSAKGDDWSVRLPSGYFLIDQYGGSLEFEDSSFSFSPRDGELADVSWQLPFSVSYKDSKDQVDDTYRLDFSKQIGKGVFSTHLRSFIDFEAKLDDLILVLNKKIKLSVSQLGLSGKSRKVDSERFDSFGFGHITGLNIFSGTSAFELDEFRITAALGGSQINSYSSALGELIQGATTRPRLFSFDEPMSDSLAVGLHLGGLEYRQELRQLSLRNGYASFAVDGLRETRSSLAVGLNLTEFQANPIAAIPKELLPHSINADLDIESLPNISLAKLSEDFLAISDTAGTPYATGIILSDFWKLMKREKPWIGVTIQKWQSDMLGLRGTAKIRPHDKAALGWEATIDFEIDRLSNFISHLRSNQNTQRLVQFLTILQGLGIPVDPDKPGGARRYKVKSTVNGEMTVNDTDIMPLITSSIQ